ncbi:hypothetical protein [Streptomyces sp. TLI_171]|uniref:hypothetical protein n=1 Tax=Streptomyces sp. TLI_171 TaxID=1938859 RepID=UPI000C1866E8|nr:hypothetical protein [Streptomyces sp. TLI_171]RKE23478.1 hypothetical protein BX266_6949 [Streptomyces sp. TLI_171]
MDIRTSIAQLTEEAEREIHDGGWEVAEGERLLARKVADGLTEAVDVPTDRQDLSETVRLEDLREAIAVVAITLARTHGHLAWFLGNAGTALSPVLHWRSLPADPEHAFGTIVPTPSQFTDAEVAVRQLRDTLIRIAGT